MKKLSPVKRLKRAAIIYQVSGLLQSKVYQESSKEDHEAVYRFFTRNYERSLLELQDATREYYDSL
jgi:hypothetical protein